MPRASAWGGSDRRQLSGRKLVSEHGKAAAGCFFFHLVLDDVPVLGEFAILKAYDIRNDPVNSRPVGMGARPAIDITFGRVDQHPIRQDQGAVGHFVEITTATP
jgi:hypothetical protein